MFKNLSTGLEHSQFLLTFWDKQRSTVLIYPERSERMGTARFKYLVKIQMFDRYFDIERKFKYLVISKIV